MALDHIGNFPILGRMTSQAVVSDLTFMNVRMAYLAVGGQTGKFQSLVTGTAFNLCVCAGEIEAGRRVGELRIAQHFP